jgi:tight adherence protein C
METMLIVGSSALVGSIWLLWWSFATSDAGKARVNLTAGLEPAGAVRRKALDTPTLTRLLGPAAGRLARAARRFTPAGHSEALNNRLVRAGNPMGLDVSTVLGIKVLLAILALLFTGLIFVVAPSAGRFIMVILGTVLGFNLPDLLLKAARDRRTTDVRVQAADIVDQLTIIVEAGLGLEAAMARVASSTEGPLADEFRRTLQDIRAGVPRGRALKELGERVDLPEIRQLTTAIVQAEAHGVPIARTLRVQSSDIRVRRHQAAEERAMKLPVKIIFPTMFCIMPALFLVILGPAVIRISNSLGG